MFGHLPLITAFGIQGRIRSDQVPGRSVPAMDLNADRIGMKRHTGKSVDAEFRALRRQIRLIRVDVRCRFRDDGKT